MIVYKELDADVDIKVFDKVYDIMHSFGFDFYCAKSERGNMVVGFSPNSHIRLMLVNNFFELEHSSSTLTNIR
jgi:hypothetical protein